jgi:hypothetical protein
VVVAELAAAAKRWLLIAAVAMLVAIALVAAVVA